MNSKEDFQEKTQEVHLAQRDILFPIPPFSPLPQGWETIPAVESGEPLVCLNNLYTQESRIILSPIYFQEGLVNASLQMYARSAVANALVRASELLPEGHKLIVYDAYRSPETQQALYDRERKNMRIKHPSLLEEELDLLTQQYVALPSWNKEFPSPHGSGGAVDVAIIGPDGIVLDMGTTFDSLDESSHTAYFAQSENPTEIAFHNNRQLLHSVMLQAGFTNYPGEWWHFDMGNRVQASLQGRTTAEYGLPDPIE